MWTALILFAFVFQCWGQHLVFYPSLQFKTQQMNYSTIFCYHEVEESHAGEVFKIFVERRYHKRPCQIFIPSRVFVYFFVNFHFPSIASLFSGNAENPRLLSHVSGVVMPRLHEPTIHGPIYVPCNYTRIVFRSLDLRDSLLFAFIKPSKQFLDNRPDPDSCEYNRQTSQLRKSIGYVKAPWIQMQNNSIETMQKKLHDAWKVHSQGLPEFNQTQFLEKENFN